MEILKINASPALAGRSNLSKAIGILQSGGVVMHPTETCYGLTVDIFNEKAVERLYSLKKMQLDKPTSIMVRDLDEALKYGEFFPEALKLAKRFWPGPLTLLVPRRLGLPIFLNKWHESVGIRCPDSLISKKLIEGVGRAIATTSANVSGFHEVYKVEDLVGLKPDLILDGGELQKNPPSTIVGFKNGEVVVLREGSVKTKDLKDVLRI